MHVVLTGASGLIGTPLTARLRAAGHEVTTWVRRAPRDANEATWDPAAGRIDEPSLERADVVVCLSGAGVGAHRWTPAYKRTLISSRTDAVHTVSRALAERGRGALVSASAVGYYGDTGDRVVTETAAAGDGFLAQLCLAWEAATAPATEAGLRVVRLRTGLVLSADGGLLAQLRPIVRLGIAGPLGSGRQYMPWIALEDELAAIEFAIESDLAGPVNLTAPNPVPNAEFMHTLGKVLGRPTILPTPGIALKAVLGELAGDALTGQRAVPAALDTAGFSFRYPDLEPALRAAL